MSEFSGKFGVGGLETKDTRSVPIEKLGLKGTLSMQGASELGSGVVLNSGTDASDVPRDSTAPKSDKKPVEPKPLSSRGISAMQGKID